jgi:hypothetical protein
VEIVDVLGVEAVSHGCGTQTDGDGFTRAQIQTAEPKERVGFLAAIDSRPHLELLATLNPGVELAAGEERQQLTTGRHPALVFEEDIEIVWHADDRRSAGGRPREALRHLGMNPRLWTAERA